MVSEAAEQKDQGSEEVLKTLSVKCHGAHSELQMSLGTVFYYVNMCPASDRGKRVEQSIREVRASLKNLRVCMKELQEELKVVMSRS